jgi:hypothetical protein
MELINALSSPETQMNGNFQTLEWAQVYGRRAEVTTGLTWGYYGGVMWGGIMVADGTLTLTDAAANYIVVNKSTGVISVSTAATNWNDTATYARVYKVTTAAGVVSAVEDHRAGQYGIILGVPGPAGADGAAGVVLTEDAEPAGATDGNQWFESDSGNLYMRYQNPDGTFTWIQTNAGSAGQSPPGSVNAIINGDMNIWQRGTSFVSITSGACGADRWRYYSSGAARHTLSRDVGAPVALAGRFFTYSLALSCTTADTALAAGDNTFLTQAIEGYNWVPCAQRACTLSFWVMATKPGVYCISLTTGDRSFIAEYTVNAATTWEFKVIAIPPSPSAGTWNYTNGVGIFVKFTLASGSQFITTAGSWQTGHFMATANQVNATDTVDNNFIITGVDLRPGTFTAPQFVSRSFGEELALCQRYYEKSGDDPQPTIWHTSTTQAAGPYFFWHQFAVAKRAAPVVTTPDSGSVNVSARGPSSHLNVSGFEMGITTTAAGAYQQSIWTADAEL